MLRHLALSPSGAMKWLVVSAGGAVIIALGVLRIFTDAQFTFASLMLLPVLANAWFVGRIAGWLSALLAASMWVYAEYVTSDGDAIRGILLLNLAVHLLNYGIVIELARTVRNLLDEEVRNARIDKLTGVMNRRGFMETFEEHVQLARRLNASLAVSLIDLDCFKQLNDTGGHQAGDEALKALGAALMEAARSTDVVGRLGGDEFCTVAFVESFSDAEIHASRLHARLARALSGHAPVGVSIGVVYFERVDLSSAEMIHCADQAMYAIKQAGKGRVLVRNG